MLISGNKNAGHDDGIHHCAGDVLARNTCIVTNETPCRYCNIAMRMLGCALARTAGAAGGHVRNGRASAMVGCGTHFEKVNPIRT
ncbi:hypothetical protein GXY_14527 [Novacetimonas hansenii ATCC 23769]|uniref:Uncharacterized protein n=1 Tax=Novacetimonas hansenii ATCC 23769 TaxID=714995 RepID=D5QIC4_NOVHA|nr:hypothetical protein GXY_14527 [Novacetimonas hansenii ATCC 23769]